MRELPSRKNLCGEAAWPPQATDELLRVLASAGQVRSLERGGQLFQLGDAAEGVFLIVKGAARAALTGKPGHELVSCTAGPGAVLGLPSAMCSKSYQFDVAALDSLEAVYLPVEQLNEILRERPELCMQVMNLMCDELSALRQAHDHMQSCTNHGCSLHGSCRQEGCRQQ